MNIEEKHPKDDAWIADMVAIEDSSEGCSLGGLASELGLYRRPERATQHFLSRFLELVRRHRGLTRDALSEKSGVPSEWIAALEAGVRTALKEDVLESLTSALGLRISPEKLGELSGRLPSKNRSSNEAMMKLITASEPSVEMSKAENRALEAFIEAEIPGAFCTESA